MKKWMIVCLFLGLCSFSVLAQSGSGDTSVEFDIYGIHCQRDTNPLSSEWRNTTEGGYSTLRITFENGEPAKDENYIYLSCKDTWTGENKGCCPEGYSCQKEEYDNTEIFICKSSKVACNYYDNQASCNMAEVSAALSMLDSSERSNWPDSGHNIYWDGQNYSGGGEHCMNLDRIQCSWISDKEGCGLNTTTTINYLNLTGCPIIETKWCNHIYSNHTDLCDKSESVIRVFYEAKGDRDGCADYHRDFECSASIRLPFVGFWGIVSTIFIIALFYFFMNYNSLRKN